MPVLRLETDNITLRRLQSLFRRVLSSSKSTHCNHHCSEIDDVVIIWQVLQLHNAAEQFVELTEMFLGEGHERTDEDFQAEKRVQAGWCFFFHLLNLDNSAL